VIEKIRAAGGEIYAITSEPQNLADQAHEHWGLQFESIGDPHQEIARTCNERGWLTLYTNRGRLEFLQRGANWKVEHPRGHFQPGVLALTAAGRVLYRWRSVPSMENLQGTVARPTPGHVFSRIDQALAAGDATGDAAHDDRPEVDQSPPPIPVFVALLLANGWFLRARSFAYGPDAPPLPRRFAVAGARLVGFVLAWVAALAFLPTLPVLLAFGAWAFWAWRDVDRVLWSAMDHSEIVARD
jgi:hypothetical protein